MHTPHPKFRPLLWVSVAALTALLPGVSLTATPPPTASSAGQSQSASANDLHFKPDAKQAKQAYKEGLEAERSHDWQAAYDSYIRAVEWAPDNKQYLFRREFAKGQLIQTKVDAAEKDAVSGDLAKARRELLEAYQLDPTDRTIRERVAELSVLEPRHAKETRPRMRLVSEIRLRYGTGTRNFNFRGATED